MKKYSAVEHLALSVWLNHKPGERFLSMFTAYFDDSGGQDTAAMLVAGFVSSVEKWLSFEKEWYALLGDRIFRMADIAAGQGDFLGISNPEKNALVKRAVEITKEHIEYSFSASMWTKDFNAVNDKFMFKEIVKSAYAFCGLGCAWNARNWLRKQQEEDSHMRYVFEDQPNDTGGLTKLMRYYNFPVPDFETKNTKPLQAADLIAWEHQRFHTGIAKKEYRQHADLRKSLKALSESNNYKWNIFNESTLVKWCEEFKVPPRKSDYENFEQIMDKILKVPHSEIKAKLEAEKQAKKRKKSKKSSASGREPNDRA